LRKSARFGFSLIEILIALAITVSALVILLGFLGLAADTSKHSQDETLSVFMAGQVRSRLLTDAAWPPGTLNKPLSGDLDAEGFPVDSFDYEDLYFDYQGTALSTSAPTEERVYQGILTFRRSPSYNSPRLDLITLQLKSLETGEDITGFTLQRARLNPRPGS